IKPVTLSPYMVGFWRYPFRFFTFLMAPRNYYLYTYTSHVVYQSHHGTENGRENDNIGYAFFPVTIVFHEVAEIYEDDYNENADGDIGENAFDFVCQLLRGAS